MRVIAARDGCDDGDGCTTPLPWAKTEELERERGNPMDIVTELQAALRHAVTLLRTHVEPASLGGERFDLTDAKDMRSIFAALQRTDSDRCERVTMPDPAPRKAPIAFAPDTLAFPTNGPVYVSAGLTKREYCAAMAMQGQMANAEILVRYGLYAADIARAAVAQADALIAALNAEPQS